MANQAQNESGNASVPVSNFDAANWSPSFSDLQDLELNEAGSAAQNSQAADSENLIIGNVLLTPPRVRSPEVSKDTDVNVTVNNGNRVPDTSNSSLIKLLNQVNEKFGQHQLGHLIKPATSRPTVPAATWTPAQHSTSQPYSATTQDILRQSQGNRSLTLNTQQFQRTMPGVTHGAPNSTHVSQNSSMASSSANIQIIHGGTDRGQAQYAQRTYQRIPTVPTVQVTPQVQPRAQSILVGNQPRNQVLLPRVTLQAQNVQHAQNMQQVQNNLKSRVIHQAHQLQQARNMHNNLNTQQTNNIHQAGSNQQAAGNAAASQMGYRRLLVDQNQFRALQAMLNQPQITNTPAMQTIPIRQMTPVPQTTPVQYMTPSRQTTTVHHTAPVQNAPPPPYSNHQVYQQHLLNQSSGSTTVYTATPMTHYGNINPLADDDEIVCLEQPAVNNQKRRASAEAPPEVPNKRPNIPEPVTEEPQVDQVIWPTLIKSAANMLKDKIDDELKKLDGLSPNCTTRSMKLVVRSTREKLEHFRSNVVSALGWERSFVELKSTIKDLDEDINFVDCARAIKNEPPEALKSTGTISDESSNNEVARENLAVSQTEATKPSEQVEEPAAQLPPEVLEKSWVPFTIEVTTDGTKMYKCNYPSCELSFFLASTIERHLKQEHKYSKEAVVQNHRSSLGLRATVKCPDCDKRFASKESILFKVHRDEHEKTAADLLKKNTKISKKCTGCEKSFISVASLTKHETSCPGLVGQAVAEDGHDEEEVDNAEVKETEDDYFNSSDDTLPDGTSAQASSSKSSAPSPKIQCKVCQKTMHKSSYSKHLKKHHAEDALGDGKTNEVSDQLVEKSDDEASFICVTCEICRHLQLVDKPTRHLGIVSCMTCYEYARRWLKAPKVIYCQNGFKCISDDQEAQQEDPKCFACILTRAVRLFQFPPERKALLDSVWPKMKPRIKGQVPDSGSGKPRGRPKKVIDHCKDLNLTSGQRLQLAKQVVVSIEKMDVNCWTERAKALIERHESRKTKDH
ncbi:hypothetical protein HDE_02182 [Halotydeus destructor]|nr:hypothetical protein HDE_02182 [Halotydeus destructor]